MRSFVFRSSRRIAACACAYGLTGPSGAFAGGAVLCPAAFHAFSGQNVAVAYPFFSKSSAARELLPPPFQVNTSWTSLGTSFMRASTGRDVRNRSRLHGEPSWPRGYHHRACRLRLRTGRVAS